MKTGESDNCSTYYYSPIIQRLAGTAQRNSCLCLFRTVQSVSQSKRRPSRDSPSALAHRQAPSSIPPIHSGSLSRSLSASLALALALSLPLPPPPSTLSNHPLFPPKLIHPFHSTSVVLPLPEPPPQSASSFPSSFVFFCCLRGSLRPGSLLLSFLF